MGRSTFCVEEGMNRGAWTAKEDKLLTDCIKLRGEGKWRTLSAAAGLKRCGKSCRLRWLNYLRPNIKRGNITSDEEDLIIRLHKLLGNRWSLIAGRIPGRTDNEVKNYWNTYLAKRFGDQSKSTNKQRRQSKEKKPLPIKAPPKQNTYSCIVHTKASKCTKLFFDPLQQRSENNAMSNRYGWGDRSISDVYNLVDSGFKKSKEVIQSESCEEVLFPSTRTENDWTDSWMDLNMGGIFTTGFLNSDFQQLYEESHENISENHDNIISDTNTNDNNFPSSLVNPFLFSDNMNWIDEQCVPYHVVNP